MIVQRLIAPGSKLSATRRFAQTTLADELPLSEVTEPELLGAMDWLLERQDRIERTLARRHLKDAGESDGFVLYDLSSSYVEGRCCPLATLGYSRDGKKGKLQVNYGLICSPDGRPVGVRVHEGRTTDSADSPRHGRTIRARFGIEQIVFVGDRGMITQAHAQSLKAQGVDFISALKSVQIRSLVNSGELQLSLFDEVNLAEITSVAVPRRAARGVPQPGRRGRTRPQTRRPARRHRGRARQGQSDGHRARAEPCAPQTPARSASAPDA